MTLLVRSRRLVSCRRKVICDRILPINLVRKESVLDRRARGSEAAALTGVLRRPERGVLGLLTVLDEVCRALSLGGLLEETLGLVGRGASQGRPLAV